MLNSHDEAVLQTQLRALHRLTLKDSAANAPLSASITALMRHGGLYTLLDPDLMNARLGVLLADAPAIAPVMQARAESFFTRLVPQAYLIPSGLMSHIAFPYEGDTYTLLKDETDDPKRYESPEIPAIFTFVGQFIDHDLTMNAVDLFLPQQDPLPPTPGFAEGAPNPVADGASPLIDLDSVYGPRRNLSSPDATLFDNFRFRMTERKDGTIDLVRASDGTPIIADMRNDENQLILQVHLLVESMHNKFMATLTDVEDGMARFIEARRQTILNWQVVVLEDYLPRIVMKDVLVDVVEQVQKRNYGDLRHKPLLDLATNVLDVNMPHEFAIGFRFGHSQLKRAYLLNPENPETPLFDNSLVGSPGPEGIPAFADLRGHQALTGKNRIDWPTFFGDAPVASNRIDGKVTAPVYDLPESAIPDDIKYIGNLPHRNLIRSRQVGVCSGEALADFYGIPRVPPETIEPDASKRDLYMQNEARPPTETAVFETPLWYYILREAEAVNASPGPNASKLGHLGSRLVAEVIVGAIAWADVSLLHSNGWKSSIPGEPSNHLKNVINWAYATKL